MTMCRYTVGGIVAALAVSACTLDQTETPGLTGPSTFATSVSVTANPDVISLGNSSTAPGQRSEIIIRVFDANGQPKAGQAVRLDTVPSGCGQLSPLSVTTGADGRALASFTAPGNPPNCPGFNADGTVGVRATPVGSQASTAAASTANIVMTLPAFASSPGALTPNFTISSLAGSRNFQFNGTSSVPASTITSFRWSFSDGHAENGAIIDHDFGAAGTYVVTLTVSASGGQEASKSALVTAP
jgi:hypothetical protein